jgi:hypothetical protein
LGSHDRALPQYHSVLGRQLVRIRRWNDPPLPKLTPLRPPPEEEPVAPPVEEPPAPTRRRPSARAVARDLLPPVVTRAVRRARRRLHS